MRAILAYPIPPAPRTAVLVSGLRSKGSIRVFPEGWSAEAARFQPQSIAARLDQIEALSGVVHPTHALIVLRGPDEPALSWEARVRLWRTFRVPMFEQIVSPDGALLAWECEAHCGLHIESRRLVVGDQELDRAPCACGKSTPRLVTRAVVAQAVAASGR